MKELLKNLYKYIYNKDIVEIPKIIVPEKTNRERLYELAVSAIGSDPTPNDEQPDEFACVHSLTTIVRKLLPDFQIMTYTPTLTSSLRSDKRFIRTPEAKE